MSLQGTHCILRVTGLFTKLSNSERLGVLLGALALNVGHPGLNNQFQQHTRSIFAITCVVGYSLLVGD